MAHKQTPALPTNGMSLAPTLIRALRIHLATAHLCLLLQTPANLFTLGVSRTGHVTNKHQLRLNKINLVEWNDFSVADGAIKSVDNWKRA